MSFLSEFFEGEKQKVFKENDTQSESSEGQKQVSPEFQNERQKKFTSILNLRQYFHFIVQSETCNRQIECNFTESLVNTKNCLEESLQFFKLKTLQTQKIGQLNETIQDENFTKKLFDFQNLYRIDIQRNLLFSKRFKKENKFSKQLVIHEILPSKSHEVLKIQVQLMWYKTQLIILNQLQNNPVIKFSPIASSGSFGNVYFSRIFDQFIAIKCLPFQSMQDIHKKSTFDQSKLDKISSLLVKALKEYFFILLFSQLHIGPQAKTIGGFDMVIYHDSIVFATEICSEHKTTDNFADLKSSLLQMHMLQVVHRDIKPSNIMYSETYKKNVFIDFGCTEVLDDKIGQKSWAQFVGTTAFCSEQVLLLLADKRKKVDLYFNDIQGFKKSLQKIKCSQVIIQQQQKNFQKLWQLELISLKNSLYALNDQKFHSDWKLLRKEYPQKIQDLQKRILYFFKDLKPNDCRRKLYWESIHQDIKCLPQFKDLEIVFRNQHSRLLFYLDIDQSKIDAFKIRRFLFKTLQIQLSQQKPKQKEIQLCLMNKITMEKEISSLLSQLNSAEIKSKESTSQKVREDFEKLCQIVCEYSSLLSNSNTVSIQQKVKTCSQVLLIVEKSQEFSLDKLEVIFKCPINFLEPISLFYQYFLLKIFPKLSSKYRTKAMVQTISNLSLLGYPIYDYLFAIRYLQNHFISLGQSIEDLDYIKDQKRIQKINNYWQCKNILLLFNHVFYDRNITRSLIKLTQQNQDLFIAFRQKLMTPKDFEKSTFFDFNYRFYNSIATNIRDFNQRKLLELIDILDSTELLKICSSNKLIKKWKRLVCFSLCYVSTAHKLKNTFQVLKLLQKQQIFQCQENRMILPFLLFFYWDQFLQSHLETHHLFKKIDQIIGYKDLSIRFQLQTRYRVAIERKDFENMKKIVKFITKQIEVFSISRQNINFIKNILMYIHGFFNSYLKKLPNLNVQLFDLLHVCYPIVQLGMEIGINFLQNQRNKQLRLSVISKENNNTDITLIQIQNEITERQLIKSLAYQLICIGGLYNNIDTHISALKNSISQSKSSDQNQIDQGKIFLDKIDKNKVTLPENYNIFLKKLQNEKIIFDYSNFWMQVLHKNKNIRQEIKRFRNIAIQFAVLFMRESKNKQEIMKSPEIIGEIFDQIRVDKFDQAFGDFNLPTFNIVYDYILIELVKSNYELYWCNQMIKLYQACWEKRFIKEIILHEKSVRYIFNCLVYTNASFNEIKTFLSRFSLVLKQYPKQKCIRNFNDTLRSLFWCKCVHCFPRKPQKWDQYQFSQYLSLTVKQEKEIQNPYMSIVYYYNMPNKYLSNTTIRRFVMSILRSMPYLVIQAKQIIMQGIYFFVFSFMFRDRKSPNDFIKFDPTQSVQKQFLKKFNSSSTRFMQKTFQNFVTQLILIDPHQSFDYKVSYRKITKKQLKKSYNQKLLYYYGMFKKHQQCNYDSLQSLIEKRFFKEQFVQNYYFPKFVKKAYMRKMKRYHQLKQNYKQSDTLIQLFKFTRGRQIQL